MSDPEQSRSLGPGVPMAIARTYPHMMPIDTEVWQAFLRFEPNYFERIWYDVHVGQAMSVPEGSPGYMEQVVMGVSRKRIDLVGLRHLQYWIIEIKPIANMEALGQVATYIKLFHKEFPRLRPIHGGCICWEVDQDLEDDFAAAGFELIQVKEFVGQFRE
jgi:hypothetical protein